MVVDNDMVCGVGAIGTVVDGDVGNGVVACDAGDIDRAELGVTDTTDRRRRALATTRLANPPPEDDGGGPAALLVVRLPVALPGVVAVADVGVAPIVDARAAAVVPVPL